jgi:NAD(P)-dependent dehydrogenase (short-subunit alcohol dehydrogenase family)
MRLKDKVAIVVGASAPGGIGAETARRFAAEGARVIVSARRREPLEAMAAEIGGKAFVCDVGDHDQVAALAAFAVAEEGGLDIAVNSSYVPGMRRLDEETPETVGPMFQTTMMGGLWFIKHMGKAMRPDGAIVMISSLVVPRPGAYQGIYSMAKAAVDQAVRVAAFEFRDKRLRINSVGPGLVKTDSTAFVFNYDAVIAAYESETPLGRMGRPADIAAAVLFAVSDECFMTGQYFDVSGGGTLTRLPDQEAIARLAARRPASE